MTLKRLFTGFVLAAVAILSLSLYLILPASPAASQGDGGETPSPPPVYFPSIFKNHATGELAFISERDLPNVDIYLTNSYGTTLKNLSNTPECLEYRFAWSPDGSKMAYSSSCNGDYGIYVMNSDGSGKYRVTGNMVYGYSLAWSMDGTQIAFDSLLGGNADIYVVKPDGSGLKKLTHDPNPDILPSWSPTDFNKIVYICDATVNNDICVINSDGTGLKNLTEKINDISLTDGASAWSPDGSEILFFSMQDNDFDIFIINSDGTGIRDITNRLGWDADPRWSPDGKKIVFDAFSPDHLQEGIAVINVDGTGFKLLTNSFFMNSPLWSPDMTKIAMAGYPDGNEEVYVMNSDGTGFRDISDSPNDDYFPVWRP